MIKDLLKRENVNIVDCVQSWEDAVLLATQSLVDQGFVTQAYPQAIINLTKEYGPYYVLAPNVALIHARPEDGVIDTQIAITLLKEPVYFAEHHQKPARLLIALAAQNSKDHLVALQRIAELLFDDSTVNKLLEIQNKDELYNSFVI